MLHGRIAKNVLRTYVERVRGGGEYGSVMLYSGGRIAENAVMTLRV